MATVKNPFMSLAASGSIGKATASELRQHRAAVAAARGHTHVIRHKPRKPKVPPTQAQLTHRAKVKAAATAWKTLGAPAQAIWKSKGVTVRLASRVGLAFTVLHGYALFLREWITQNSTAQSLPMLPA